MKNLILKTTLILTTSTLVEQTINLITEFFKYI